MRRVTLVYAPRADELVKKVNSVFETAEKLGSKIYKTQYIYANMDKYYCYIEYESEVPKKK